MLTLSLLAKMIAARNSILQRMIPLGEVGVSARPYQMSFATLPRSKWRLGCASWSRRWLRRFVYCHRHTATEQIVDVDVSLRLCQTMFQYPSVQDTEPSTISEEDAETTIKQLEHLAFTPKQAKAAVDFLSLPSSLSTSLLTSLQPLEAAIEYLILHVAECDLPGRFLPSVNSSNPFVTSAHAGGDDLRRRWIEDRAVKEAGWPSHVVRECAASEALNSWELLIWALGQRLIGESCELVPCTDEQGQPLLDKIDFHDAQALGGYYDDSSTLIIPMFSAPIKLHILSSPSVPAPHLAIYLSSSSVPAYVRLHLLASLLKAIKNADFVHPEEGLCMAALRNLEGEWGKIEDNGPPDISDVLIHLIPPIHQEPETEAIQSEHHMHTSLPERRAREYLDDRTDAQIKGDFESLRRTQKYEAMLPERSKLPAFSAKDDFLHSLEHNRVVVVVGETGKYILLHGRAGDLTRECRLRENNTTWASIALLEIRELDYNHFKFLNTF
jgi:ATP-dependent RNA helicase DHX57